MKRHPVRAAVVAVAIAAAVGVVRGYVFPSPSTTWPDGQILMHLQLGTASAPLVDGSASLDDAFSSALQTWNQYLGRVQFTSQAGTAAAIGSGNRVNNVIRDSAVFGQPFGDGVLAVTSYWYNETTNIRSEADIIFNSAVTWNAYRGPLRAGMSDIVRVGLRQIGGALGIAYADRQGQVVDGLMNATIGDRDSLSPDDIAAAAALYGGGSDSPATATAAQVSEYRAETNAYGVATFALGAARSFPVQFVDQSTGSPIAGARAYLYTDPNGLAVAMMSDPLGRYFSQMAPVRLTVGVSAAGGRIGALATTGAVQVPVPAVSDSARATASHVVDFIAESLSEPWRVVQRQAINLWKDARLAEVVVDRTIRLEELPDLGLDRLFEDSTDNALEILIEANQRNVAGVIAGELTKWYNPLSTATGYRDDLWRLKRLELEFKGYTSDQQFDVKVLRAPVDLPEALRDYTEWTIYISARESPRFPLIPASVVKGVVSGRLTDLAGTPLSGVVEFSGPETFRVFTGANGLFATDPILPGLYSVNGSANGHRRAGQLVEVRGDGAIEQVTLALVALGVGQVVVTPSSQTILPTNTITRFSAMAYDAAGAAIIAPAPVFTYASDTRAVASIDQYTGAVTPVRPGRALITAQARGITSAPATLIVADPCTYALSATSVAAPASGGPVSVTVTTSTGCAWTATSSSAFLTVTSGGSGSGTGTVQVQVAANSSTASRSGSLTVAGQTVTITQAAAPECTYTLSRTGVSVGAAGASGLTVGVTASSGCTWTAAESSSFISITGGSSGTGSGTVTFTVSANTGAARSGTLTVAGQAVTVSQSAGTTTGGQDGVGAWTFRGSGCDRSADPLPGWLNCRGTITVSVTQVNRSGFVSVFMAYPDSGSFYHGQVAVTAGRAPGTVSISVVNNYVPRCVSSYATTISVYDGAQSANDPPLIGRSTGTLTFTCS